ncbi:hypothetical protein GQ55_9G628400 [Panicum hallii var. hallii]|uniref:Uncharacterized protein n=1 Tax=Panicum hallii var. hallii TaxID=1504633 RepID=A0A2T7CI87_9POAL|nr:hypothetical protein GQ55_9G628400 [Panicum hallii var. hallii]
MRPACNSAIESNKSQQTGKKSLFWHSHPSQKFCSLSCNTRCCNSLSLCCRLFLLQRMLVCSKCQHHHFLPRRKVK